jgi:hypothetical protein
MALSLAIVATLPAFAKKSPADDIWSLPSLGSQDLPEIAILPAVVIGGDRLAARVVEERWLSRFDSTGHRWSLAREQQNRLAAMSVRQDSVRDEIARQIYDEGRIDRVTAMRVARTLGVRALLCLRVNRWERLPEPSPEHPVAIVELEARLIDSTGALLWKASGIQRQQTSSGRLSEYEQHLETTKHVVYRKQSNSTRVVTELNSTPAVDVKPGTDIIIAGWKAIAPPDFESALGTLLGRWAGVFPHPAPPKATRRDSPEHGG